MQETSVIAYFAYSNILAEGIYINAGDYLPELNDEFEKIHENIFRIASPIKSQSNRIFTAHTMENLPGSTEGPLIRSFHYAGHSQKDGLWLNKNNLQNEKYPCIHFVANLVRMKNLNLVVLNACDTSEVAKELISRWKDREKPYAIIYTSDKINSQKAVDFSTAFYTCLTGYNANTVQDAFESACRVVKFTSEKIDENQSTSVLKFKSFDEVEQKEYYHLAANLAGLAWTLRPPVPSPPPPQPLPALDTYAFHPGKNRLKRCMWAIQGELEAQVGAITREAGSLKSILAQLVPHKAEIWVYDAKGFRRDTETYSLEELLAKRLQKERRWLLLGEAGMGKTRLMQWLAVRSLRREVWSRNGLHVAYIPLGSQNAMEMIAQIGAGTAARTMLLLDGLDEAPVAQAGGYADYANRLLGQAQLFHTVIISSRIELFVNDKQIPKNARDAMGAATTMLQVRLAGFNYPDFEKRYKSKNDQFPFITKDNFELWNRPLLWEILRTFETDEKFKSKKFLTEAAILSEATESWLATNSDKQLKYLPLEMLNAERPPAEVLKTAMQQGMRTLALKMYELGRNTVSAAEAQTVVAPFLLSVFAELNTGDAQTTPDVATATRLRTLLHRDAAGNQSFAHSIFLDYYWAELMRAGKLPYPEMAQAGGGRYAQALRYYNDLVWEAVCTAPALKKGETTAEYEALTRYALGKDADVALMDSQLRTGDKLQVALWVKKMEEPLLRGGLLQAIRKDEKAAADEQEPRQTWAESGQIWRYAGEISRWLQAATEWAAHPAAKAAIEVAELIAMVDIPPPPPPKPEEPSKETWLAPRREAEALAGAAIWLQNNPEADPGLRWMLAAALFDQCVLANPDRRYTYYSRHTVGDRKNFAFARAHEISQLSLYAIHSKLKVVMQEDTDLSPLYITWLAAMPKLAMLDISKCDLPAELQKSLKRPGLTLYTTAQEEQNPSLNYTEEKAGIEMCYIPGGSFEMGDVLDDNAYENEKPVHTVRVGSFFMAATCVTVAQFRAFVQDTEYHSKHPHPPGRGYDGKYQTDAERGDIELNLRLVVANESWQEGDSIANQYKVEETAKRYRKGAAIWVEGKGQVWQEDANWRMAPDGSPAQDDHPVVFVSWNDAQAYCDWLSEKAKASGRTYRLPTEAEWEYAAREGGKAVRFGNGKDIADSKEMNFDARKAYKRPYSEVGEYRGATVPVQTFAPNALGLYQMSGNVWEWCQDWYDKDYYKNSPSFNPINSDSGKARVLRGGSWNDNAGNCRVAIRNVNSPGNRNSNNGFRLVASQD